MLNKTLIFLLAVLLTTGLALMLTACASASPCQPRIHPSTINARMGLAGMVDAVGVTCTWSY